MYRVRDGESERRRAHGSSDDTDVMAREAELMKLLHRVLVETRALPPITLGSGRSGLADKFKAYTRLFFCSRI